jgi:hypothetical protein
MSRRTLLKLAAAVELGAALPGAVRGEATSSAGDALAAYLEALRRPDGGYGWEDQESSHLTPTFAAVGCYHRLGRRPPNVPGLVAFIRAHHPAQLARQKRLEQEHREFEFQQIQSLVWLGAEVTEFRDVVSGWRRPVPYMARYEQHGYPIFRFQLTAFTCRALLGLPTGEIAPEFLTYLDERRRGTGSFNNTPAADRSDGHVLNTWWGLEALKVLGREREQRDATIAWLRGCQRPDGGFTYQPGAALGGVTDVAYTWAAVRALALLDAAPGDREGCLRSLGSLSNADGGFGPRPGWASNPVATYYALDALAAMGSGNPAATPAKPRPAARRTTLSADLRIYSIQLEAHGQGSPAEAVDLAGALRIQLWGAKNARAGWIARAQAIADTEGVPVTFFVADEEYNTWVDVPGLGTYSHTCDIVAPAHAGIGASLAGKGVVSWPEFRDRRLAPLEAAGGRLVWQFGENEELTRIFLDDSLERGGYAAISTYHFGNPDFTNSEPFLMHYRGRVPFVALQDAHGNEPWWFADMTAGFRTLFLAREPVCTWEAWLTALRNNWVVAVRHDDVSGGRTWMHGGGAEVVEFVRRRERQWRWWDHPEVRRPLVSIVAVAPGDTFEAARPEQGVTIRVRCAWENTPQGLARKPIAELVTLSVDGREVEPTLLVSKAPGGANFAEHAHLYHIDRPAPGKHTATAVVRGVETGEISSRTIEFST